MGADDITDIANAALAAVGALFTLMRLALRVCDALDERFPWLHPVTDLLGTFLGGKKARYDD